MNPHVLGDPLELPRLLLMNNLQVAFIYAFAIILAAYVLAGRRK